MFSKAEAIEQLSWMRCTDAAHKCRDPGCTAVYEARIQFYTGLIQCIHESAAREGAARGLGLTPQETHD